MDQRVVQGPELPEPSTEVAEYFAEKTKELQGIQRLRARGGLQAEVFGGYVRSYGFDYDRRSQTAQGTMWVDFGSQHHVAFDVTVLILGSGKENEALANIIVDRTTRLSELSDLVVAAHFSTFDESIRQYIVVFERFDGPFFGGREGMVDQFFLDNVGIGNLPARKYRLTPYWVQKMRSFFDLLEHGARRKITHGGLGNPSSYVICSGTVKLINVGCYGQGQYIKEKDVTDLRAFIKNNPYFGGSSSEEWLSLDILLGSKLVTKFSPGWKSAVMGHPILQESDLAIIAAFDGVNKLISETGIIGATKLANLLCRYYPAFRRYIIEKNAETPAERQAVLSLFFPKEAHPVFEGLFSFTFPGTEVIAYGGEIIYLEVINLSRNLIHHGKDYDEHLEYDPAMLQALRDFFASYISTAYSLLRMLDDDPARNRAPYICPFDIPKPTPTDIVLGGFLNKAKYKLRGNKGAGPSN